MRQKKNRYTGKIKAKGKRSLAQPAHVVSNDVGVADDYLVRFLLLFARSAVDELAEAGFDAGSIFEELLQFKCEASTEEKR